MISLRLGISVHAHEINIPKYSRNLVLQKSICLWKKKSCPFQKKINQHWKSKIKTISKPSQQKSWGSVCLHKVQPCAEMQNFPPSAIVPSTKCHSAEKISPVVLFSDFIHNVFHKFLLLQAVCNFSGKLSIGKLDLKKCHCTVGIFASFHFFD